MYKYIYIYIYTYLMYHRDMWDGTMSHMDNASFVCVTWLIHMCDMTHSWFIHMCPTLMMLPSYLWHDSSICVTWLVHDSYICVPHGWCLLRICDMALSCWQFNNTMWHDLFRCVICISREMGPCPTWTCEMGPYPTWIHMICISRGYISRLDVF